VAVGHPDGAVAAVARLVDGHPRRRVALRAVGRVPRRVEPADGLTAEGELGHLAGMLVGEPEALLAVLLHEREAVGPGEAVAPGVRTRAVRLQHDDGAIGLAADDDAPVGRDGDAVGPPVLPHAGRVRQRAPPGDPLEGGVRYDEFHDAGEAGRSAQTFALPGT